MTAQHFEVMLSVEHSALLIDWAFAKVQFYPTLEPTMLGVHHHVRPSIYGAPCKWGANRCRTWLQLDWIRMASDFPKRPSMVRTDHVGFVSSSKRNVKNSQRMLSKI